MHSKIINPALHGKGVYTNRGSCARLVSYLQHEARELGQGMGFFSQAEEGISPQLVQVGIDANVKGLRSRESKFISLVLSPSADELAHIDNDPEKLRQFTRQAMQQYAHTFRLKEGQEISAGELLWFAAIHRDRAFKGIEREVLEGLRKAGERKPGFNMHVHVLVSKRDRAQQITLSPFGNRDRFDMKAWQEQNRQSFNRMFAYEPPEQTLTPHELDPARRERLQARIAFKLKEINSFLDRPQKLEMERVVAVAEQRQYHRTFFFNLNRLAQILRQDRYVRDPMHLLAHNRDRKPEQVIVNQPLASSLKQLAEASRSMGFTESLGLGEFLLRRRKHKGLTRA